MKEYRIINGQKVLVELPNLTIPKQRKTYPSTIKTEETTKVRTKNNNIVNAMSEDVRFNNVLHGVRSKLKSAISNSMVYAETTTEHSESNKKTSDYDKSTKLATIRRMLEEDINSTINTTGTLSDGMDILQQAYVDAMEYAESDTVIVKHRDGTISEVNAQYQTAKKSCAKVLNMYQRDAIRLYKDRIAIDTDTDGQTVFSFIGNTDYYAELRMQDIFINSTLTTRQKTICRYLLIGYTQNEIAIKLGVSQQAVAKQIATIRKTLDYLRRENGVDMDKLLSYGKVKTDNITANTRYHLPHIDIMPKLSIVEERDGKYKKTIGVDNAVSKSDNSRYVEWLEHPMYYHVSITETETATATAQRQHSDSTKQRLKAYREIRKAYHYFNMGQYIPEYPEK